MREVLIFFLCTLFYTTSTYAYEFTEIRIPESASSFSIGDKTQVGDMSLRITGFVTNDGINKVIEWYRLQYGKRLVENDLGTQYVLGVMENGFYITISLEKAGSGTRGLVGVRDLHRSVSEHEAAKYQKNNLISRLPSESKIFSNVSSEDSGKVSRHVVYANTYSSSINTQRVKELLSLDKFSLDHEYSNEYPDATGKNGRKGMQGTSLYFIGTDKEALAVITPIKGGGSVVVVHTISSLNTYK